MATLAPTIKELKALEEWKRNSNEFRREENMAFLNYGILEFLYFSCSMILIFSTIVSFHQIFSEIFLWFWDNPTKVRERFFISLIGFSFHIPLYGLIFYKFRYNIYSLANKIKKKHFLVLPFLAGLMYYLFAIVFSVNHKHYKKDLMEIILPNIYFILIMVVLYVLIQITKHKY